MVSLNQADCPVQSSGVRENPADGTLRAPPVAQTSEISAAQAEAAARSENRIGDGVRNRARLPMVLGEGSRIVVVGKSLVCG